MDEGVSAMRVAALHMDYETLTYRLVTQSGRTLAGTVRDPEDPIVRSSTYDGIREELTLDLAGIGHVQLDVGTAVSDMMRLGSRPVVYLDQNQWVTVAQYQAGSRNLREAERAAAAELTELALSQAAVLPLSSAHFVEAARTADSRRRHLAGTMLRLSRGWVMRNPIAVRMDELRVMLGRVGERRHPVPIPPPVINLDHASFWARRPGDSTPPFEIPGAPELSAQMGRLTVLTAHAAVLAEPDSDSAGRLAAAGWATSFAELGQHMSTNSKARPHRRGITRTRFVTDMGDDLPKAAAAQGLTPEEFSAWWKPMHEDAPAEADLAQMPYLGRVREVTHVKLSNGQERWEPNDLQDVHFLSCAAGYADLVVGERKHVGYLKRAGRSVAPGARLATNLREAVPMLREILADP